MARLRTFRQEERRRIACELHDRVSHTLLVGLQHLELHRHRVGWTAIPVAEAMAAIREALTTIQQISSELRRAVSARGLRHALAQHLAHEVPPSIRTTMAVTGDLDALPGDTAEELYLIIREAIRNAVRHADPTTIEIRLTVDACTVEVIVRDDGHGFATAATIATACGGLLSMRERAALVGGTVRWTSGTGPGTVVSVVVPTTGVS